MTSFIKEQRVDHILVDGGSFISVMPKSTMHDLGITIEKLSKSWTMIHVFNLEGKCAIGIICIKLVMGDLLIGVCIGPGSDRPGSKTKLGHALDRGPDRPG